MRGVNFGGWFSQIDAIQEKDPDTFPGMLPHIESFLSSADFAQVKEWGFDHIRLPVDYANVFDEETLEPREDVLSLLDKAIDWGRLCGLNVILDLHKCPGHDFHSGTTTPQKFFSDPSYREQAKRVWAHLAERYGGNSHVLLEILNEPVAPNAEIWNEVKDELFAEIRHFAPHAPIVVGSNLWNNASQFAHLTPVEDDNVLYSFHCYTPIVFTHQLAPWIAGDFFQERRPWPGEYPAPPQTENNLPHEVGFWDQDRLRHSLQPVLDFQEKYKVPVACNEFGVFAQVERQARMRWLREFLEILRENRIGYSYWNYKNLDFGIISQGESLHQDNEEYNQNPERRDDELLSLLTQD